MKTKIYFLRDEQGFVRYVGKTSKTLESRLKEHLWEAKRRCYCRKCNGIRAMLKRGFTPTIDLITEVDGGGCGAEIAYIRWLKNKGIELWNGTEGGDGGVLTLETRRKISKANKGQIPWSKGKKLTKEHKQKLSLAHKGIKFSESHKKALRFARIGMKFSEAHRRNISLSKKGVKKSVETRRRMSFARMGKKLINRRFV